MKATALLAETLVAAVLALPVFAQVTPTDEKVPCRDYRRDAPSSWIFLVSGCRTPASA